MFIYHFEPVNSSMVNLQGMKKHKLLREDILPSMATNRKVQRLLNEFMDLLSEYEAAETNVEQMDVTPTPPPPPAAAATEGNNNGAS